MDYRIENKKKNAYNPKFVNQFTDGFEVERVDGSLSLIRPRNKPQSAYWINASEEELKKHKNHRGMSLVYE